MGALITQIRHLPTFTIGSTTYLSHRAVMDAVAAHLYPSSTSLETAAYDHIQETTVTLCHQLGYTHQETLTPPQVPLEQAGSYWRQGGSEELVIINAGTGLAGDLAEGCLLDVYLHRWGLEEISQQYFKIPVTASEGVIDLLTQAVASDWPNDAKGIWNDILFMCVRTGRVITANERQFEVLIDGIGSPRKRPMRAVVQPDEVGDPYVQVSLMPEPDKERLFALGHVVMTLGADELGIDVLPYLARHQAGDWGELDNHDKRENNRALKEGLRLFSAYEVVTCEGEPARLWIITEADRHRTTILCPWEY